MTTGVLMFAFAGEIDYVAIARASARRVNQYLDLPVTLVTDIVLEDTSPFDQVIRVDRPSTQGIRHWQDSNITTTWTNGNRCRAYELSPYDRTLLIDADYLVGSSVLKPVVESVSTFVTAYNILNIPRPVRVTVQTFGKTQIPMRWATVVAFDRSKVTQDMFAMWNTIEENYRHYADLFNFTAKPFRNDYALTLAVLASTGHHDSQQHNLPVPLVNILPEAQVELGDIITVKYDRLVNQELRPHRVAITGQDLHIMGKSAWETLV